jgi:hypothetical protein
MSSPMVGNVVANKLNHIDFFFWKHIKLGFKNNHHMLFFLRDVIIALKTKLLIWFTSLTIIN